MPFWLHESPIKIRLRTIPFRRRLLLSSAVLIIIIGTVYFKFLTPKKLLIARHQDTFKNLQIKHGTYTTQTDEYEKLKADHDTLKNLYNDHHKHATEHQVCTDQLFDLIKQSHLTCQTFAPMSMPLSGSEITLTGSYSNLLLFFELVTDKKLPVTVTKLSIEPQKHRQLRIYLSIKMSIL